MARQEINIGASANDGTGDALRDAFDKVNDNEKILFDTLGWAYYKDDNVSPANINITTTPTLVTINGLDVNSNSEYLPRIIRGTGELWNTTTNKIEPINAGDAYDVRLDFDVISRSGNPQYMTLELDIGGGASPTISIVKRRLEINRTPTFSLSLAFPIFCLTTFFTNGGQLFLSTDTGSAEIDNQAIVIKRDFSSQL